MSRHPQGVGPCWQLGRLQKLVSLASACGGSARPTLGYLVTAMADYQARMSHEGDVADTCRLADAIYFVGLCG